MNPGQGKLCRECRHFSLAAYDRGHPNPCRQNHWEGHRHVKPRLAEDGQACENFAELPSQNHGLETESAEMLHGADALSGEIIVSAAEVVETVAGPLQFVSDR